MSSKWHWTNGRESAVNRALDGSIYPGYNLMPSSLSKTYSCWEIQQLIIGTGYAK